MLLDFDDYQRDRDSEIAEVLAGLQTPGSVQVGIGALAVIVDWIRKCMWLLVGGGVKVTGVGVWDEE